jgi:hypothetical protein
MNYRELLKLLSKNPNEAFNNAQSIKPSIEGIFLAEKHRMDFGFGSYYGTHIWFFKTTEQFVAFLPALLFFDIAIHWDDDDRNYRNYEEEEEEEDEDEDEEDDQDDEEELEEEELEEEDEDEEDEEEEDEEDEEEEEEEEDEDEEYNIRMIEDTEDYKDTFDYYKNLCEIKSFDDIRIYDLVEDSFGEVEVLDVARVSDLINISEEKFNLTFEDTDNEDEIQEMGFTWTQFKILNGYAEEYGELPSKNVEQFLAFLEECNHDWLELPATRMD